MADLQYVLFLSLFTLFFLLHEIILNRTQILKFVIRLGLMIGIFFTFAIVQIGPLIYGWLSGQYAYGNLPPIFTAMYSLYLVSFFIPSQLNYFFGGYVNGIVSHFSSSLGNPTEGITYIGYTVLALTTIAVAKRFKSAMFWTLTSLAFAVLSLGPILHIMGSTTFTQSIASIPLPGILLTYVPFFRVPVLE